MTSTRFAAKGIFVAALIPPLLFAEPALTSETVTLPDGTTCTVAETIGSATPGTSSTSVTAGNGRVSSSTTITGATAGSGSSASSSASSSATGAGSIDTLSTASVTRPDGTTVTRRSDGTCHFIKPTD